MWAFRRAAFDEQQNPEQQRPPSSASQPALRARFEETSVSSQPCRWAATPAANAAMYWGK
jgi:hypothetical protein